MSRYWLRSLFVIGMLTSPSMTLAHPGHDHDHEHAKPAGLRTWTEAKGVFELQASFVAARDGKVQLRKTDGKLVTLPIEQLSHDDQHWIEDRLDEIRKLNERRANIAPTNRQQPGSSSKLIAFADAKATTGKELMTKAFDPFVKLNAIKTRADERYFYVESNGMPDHPLMIGIRAWQQQVPLPQKYVGNNAWQIPLYPVPAKTPASAKNRFLRGAIALAVNGVPIFNPLNNRGDDAYLFGELDDYGGHCGRADDYHYHIAPVHLEKQVGKGSIIAYALDGYPIYGYDEPDGSAVVGLDGLNGHKDSHGHYHYHATKKYPYLNGGFYGEVVERDGQVDPQPRAQPVREFLPPLQGAKITDFKSTQPNSYELKYEVEGKPGYVRYMIADGGAVKFTFVDTKGNSKSETYEGRRGPPGGGGGKKKGGDRPPPPRPGDNPPPPRDGGDAPKKKEPAPGEARKPWIAEHFAELDGDKDGTLTRAEMQAEANRTFAAYDSNNDGKLVRAEYDRGGVRTAFAGFVRGHSSEVDADGDGVITKQELLDFAMKLFGKSDRDGDGKTTAAEAAIQGPGKPKE